MQGYLHALVILLDKGSDREIISYLLCHLSSQLSNKHLYRGVKPEEGITQLALSICTGVLDRSRIQLPHIARLHDIHTLLLRNLPALTTYIECLDQEQRHLLVEALTSGLGITPAATESFVHALTLAAFDMQPSFAILLPIIVQKLPPLLSYHHAVVHVLKFLYIITATPLHPGPSADFGSEQLYQAVFGIAIQSIRTADAAQKAYWSQHVKNLSYNIIYAWFLTTPLQDRSRHLAYISRQFLNVNQVQERLDDLTVLCLDWMSHHVSANMESLRETLLPDDPSIDRTPEVISSMPLTRKMWIRGDSIITFHPVDQQGWVQVTSRWPSGIAKYRCEIRNAPILGSGGDPELGKLLFLGHIYILMLIIVILQTGIDDDFGTQKDKIPALIAAYNNEKNLPNLHVLITDPGLITKFSLALDNLPVVDIHRIGVMYVAPGQSEEAEILRNTRGSPAYARFLDGLGNLIEVPPQGDSHTGGLSPDVDGNHIYAWQDDIGQIIYHIATLMPSHESDPQCVNKKTRIGNDNVRIVWNDSGKPCRFETLATTSQFLNIVIQPQPSGATGVFSTDAYGTESFDVILQHVPHMDRFNTACSNSTTISARNLPAFVRQLSRFYAQQPQKDRRHADFETTWSLRLQMIRRIK
ncbi:hypothetical protein FPV67DRAFT_1428625, partial [Lyophyllum atratum]